ncbi:hypothetical protein N657DRAFT_407866 [Parathielavia appendiculata]|uniref:Uncharacterized protein n=1 Tax=Parathielavia appendiculata TaxID=2587402 RepID=A0AAN6TZJ5_9PEZI|nr:hypothetical protein N657DRAFT_407866 [Parathielavia appendiculata]
MLSSVHLLSSFYGKALARKDPSCPFFVVLFPNPSRTLPQSTRHPLSYPTDINVSKAPLSRASSHSCRSVHSSWRASSVESPAVSKMQKIAAWCLNLTIPAWPSIPPSFITRTVVLSVSAVARRRCLQLC